MTTQVDPTGESPEPTVADPQTNFESTIKDFLDGGPAKTIEFYINHSVSKRFANHWAFKDLWSRFEQLQNDCLKKPEGYEEEFKGSYTATPEDFTNDLKTVWGRLTEGRPYGDFGIQVVGSFTYDGYFVLNCEICFKRIIIFAHNTWSIQSLTRNPITRKPLLESDKLLNPVTIEIQIERTGRFAKRGT